MVSHVRIVWSLRASGGLHPRWADRGICIRKWSIVIFLSMWYYFWYVFKRVEPNLMILMAAEWTFMNMLVVNAPMMIHWHDRHRGIIESEGGWRDVRGMVIYSWNCRTACGRFSKEFPRFFDVTWRFLSKKINFWFSGTTLLIKNANFWVSGTTCLKRRVMFGCRMMTQRKQCQQSSSILHFRKGMLKENIQPS